MPSGSRIRLDCTFGNLPWIEERILQYVYSPTFTIRHLRPARRRWRCGLPWLPCPPAQVWWYQAQLDPTTRILSFLYETWEIRQWSLIAQHMEDNCDWPRHLFDRYKFYWHDAVDRYYWSKVYDNFDHTGQHVCQTFLNSQDGWLTGVSVFLYKNLGQPLTLLISECNSDGSPGHIDKTVSRIVLDGPGVTTSLENPVLVGDIEQIAFVPAPGLAGLLGVKRRIVTEVPVYIFPCRIQIPPVYLEAGKRYGLHLITTADHSFCISDRFDLFAIHQGGYWVNGSSGLYLWPSTTNPKSLRFKLHYATWGQWQGQSNPIGGSTQAAIALAPLQLAGGIGGVDVLADSVVPPATELSYQVQINGAWQKFDADPNHPGFTGQPPLLPFRANCIGTTDLMPAFSLQNSQVTLQGGRANVFHHISQPVNFGSSMVHVKVMSKLIGFVAAHHTCTCSLHYGATKNSSPQSVIDTTNADGSIDRYWTFLVSGQTGVTIEFDGSNDGVGDAFVASQRTCWAAST
jgi:hypothetical protein